MAQTPEETAKQEALDALQRIYREELLKNRAAMIAALQSHQLGNPDAVVDSAILGVVSEMHALMRKITTFNQGTVGDFNTKATLLAQGLNGDLIRLNQKTPSPATPAPITRGRAVGK